MIVPRMLLLICLLSPPGRRGGTWTGNFERANTSLFVNAVVPCNTTSQCETLLRPGSSCDESGTCTNPFVSGCLRRLLGEESYPQLRTCSSDDEGTTDGMCSTSAFFEYMEIRLFFGNWESSLFLAWIMQILLSEIMGVPVSIETVGEGPTSFYDAGNSVSFAPSAYNFDALRTANRVGDCTVMTRDGEACAHVKTEVWSGGLPEMVEAEVEGSIEIGQGNGMVGELNFFVPEFLAERDPTIVSHFGLGLRGEEHRRKLAEMFLRPTTWGDYCRFVSPANCTTSDDVAHRAPEGDVEMEKYHVHGLYKGHFRPTEKNNCTLNPTTCTGHVVDFPCDWNGNTVQQMYWNQIALESDGTDVNGGYKYSSSLEIMAAANATRSNVMIMWWKPEPTMEAYGFFPVSLPEATEECLQHRVPKAVKCSTNRDAETTRGSPLGACGHASFAIRKVVSESLRDITYEVPKHSRSPAYDFIKNLQVTDVSMIAMLKAWKDRGVDPNNYDQREAVCTWVADNIDTLMRSVPKGYPRVIRYGADTHDSPVHYTAAATGALVTLVVLLTGAATYAMRRRRVMRYAQVHFLFFFLCGCLLVSIGAILFANAGEPTAASCVARQWFVTLGYTLGLVPLLVKVAAVNKVMNDSARFRRTQMSPRKLYGVVASALVLVMAFLIVWTVVDTPTLQEERVLMGEDGQGDGNVVKVSLNCASSKRGWLMVAYAWEALLLVCAVVLTFASWNVRQEFNESRALAVMTYSHFIFLVLRFLAYTLISKGFQHAQVHTVVISFLLSFDTLSTLAIYFGTKLLKAWLGEDYGVSRRLAFASSSTLPRARKDIIRREGEVPSGPGTKEGSNPAAEEESNPSTRSSRSVLPDL